VAVNIFRSDWVILCREILPKANHPDADIPLFFCVRIDFLEASLVGYQPFGMDASDWSLLH
jgi:hypothetical protein